MKENSAFTLDEETEITEDFLVKEGLPRFFLLSYRATFSSRTLTARIVIGTRGHSLNLNFTFCILHFECIFCTHILLTKEEITHERGRIILNLN